MNSNIGEIVKMSNVIARARLSIQSVHEARILALVAAQVRKDDEDFRDYEIPISSLITSSRGKRAYDEVFKSCTNLREKPVVIKDKGLLVNLGFFSGVTFDRENGIIKARFDPAMKEHFLSLNSRFTTFSLVDFMSLSSANSQKLFLFLKSWDDKPLVEVPLSELHEILDSGKTNRENFSNFKKFVLDPVTKFITEKTGLTVTWQGIKVGKRVKSIKFRLVRKRKKHVPEITDGNDNNNNNNNPPPKKSPKQQQLTEFEKLEQKDKELYIEAKSQHDLFSDILRSPSHENSSDCWTLKPRSLQVIKHMGGRKSFAYNNVRALDFVKSYFYLDD